MDSSDGKGIEERRIAYEPLLSQELFHSSDARFKGFSGPIGSGKSQALCHEAVKLSYLNPGRMGLLGAPTYPMLRDATQRAMIEILESNRIPYDLNKAENLLMMADTGSRIVFRAVDDFERLRGTNLAWFGMDELTYAPEESWLRLEGRLRDPLAARLCGFAVWTPKGKDWVYRRFIEQRVQGYDVIIARPGENRHILEKIPDFYERLEKSYDERFYAQEVLGEYLELGGDRVYQSFQRDEHLCEVTLDPNLPLLWTLDFNVDPMSSLVVQIQNQTVVVLNEIVLKRANTYEACEQFQNLYPMHMAGLKVFGDASGHAMQTAGTNDYRIIQDFLRRAGYRLLALNVGRSNPSVKERVNLTNSRLKNAAGTVGVRINPACRELVKDFEEVCFKTGSNVIDKDKDPKRTHLSDALGYLIWQELSEGPRLGEQSTRLL